MTDEQKAAYINSQAAVLIATVLGMQAENMQRQALGHSMAYVEEHFQLVINNSACGSNAVMELLK